MNEVLLLLCLGSKDPVWMARHVDRLAHPRCAAAVMWSSRAGSVPLYMPCGINPAAGEQLCPVHGGASKMASVQQTRLAARREHAEWREQGLALAAELRRREIDRLHERATS